MAEKIPEWQRLNAMAKKRVLTEEEARIQSAMLKREAEEREQRLRQQKIEEAEHLARSIENTILPKWVVNFIMSQAYDRGHSAGEYEVNLIANGMLSEAERYFREKT